MREKLLLLWGAIHGFDVIVPSDPEPASSEPAQPLPWDLTWNPGEESETE